MAANLFHSVPGRLILATLGVAGVVAGLLLWQARSDGESAFRPLAPEDPGPVHVHGLGLNPADGALFIATHTGLYRVGEGMQKAERVGDSRQDTMGFTIVGRNHFLGSGHPDLQAMREDGLPSNLGLIESTNAGKTWTSISLLGEADFHVLRSRGYRLYGFDSTNARLLFSGDGGRTWSRLATPGGLIDLAVHPQLPSRVVASTERGLFGSGDNVQSWRTLGEDVGFLAWPVASRLYLVDGAGEVHVSRDAGKRWATLGNIGGQPAAFLAQTPSELYVALHDGTIQRSTDGGATWTTRSTR